MRRLGDHLLFLIILLFKKTKLRKSTPLPDIVKLAVSMRPRFENCDYLRKVENVQSSTVLNCATNPRSAVPTGRAALLSSRRSAAT